MQQNSEGLRAFFSRVTPMIPELYNMAYAICASDDLAEYALVAALAEVWNSQSRGGMGFKEGLRNALRRVALREAAAHAAPKRAGGWEGLMLADDPLTEALVAQSDALRRAIALRYGCSLSISAVAKQVGMSVSEVREQLNRFGRMAARRLPPSERRHFEQKLTQGVRRAFGQAGENMPSLGAVFRAVETEVMQVRGPKRMAIRILKRAIALVLALLCALMFWLAAVLIQPSAAEAASASFVEIDAN